MELVQIHRDVQVRVDEIAAAHGDWPCRKGCDDCCRSLASVPVVSGDEWRAIEAALQALPVEVANAASQRIRESADAVRPVTCPLLDVAAEACLVYEARPVACRAYGFYAERELVLGCGRIEQLARESARVMWGNHTALQARVDRIGRAAPLFDWL